MRYKAIRCDICGKDMTNDDHQYRFKHKAYFGDERIIRKLDMCETCYDDRMVIDDKSRNIFKNNIVRQNQTTSPKQD